MIELDREDWYNLIIIFLVLTLLIVLIYGITIYKTDAFECLSNPKVYYEREVNLSCKCSKPTPFNTNYPLNLSNMVIIHDDRDLGNII